MSVLSRMRVTALRRKSVLLCVLTMVVVVVLCLQYNTTLRADPADPQHRRRDHLADILQRSRAAAGASASVQFLKADPAAAEQNDVGPAPVQDDPYLAKTLLKLPDPPTWDEVARHHRVLAELTTPPQAPPGFPGVERSRMDSNYGLGLPNVHLDHYIPPKRIVHFDLKGAPPKIDFFKKLISLSKKLGATGLLLEWEDMFPFSGNLSGIAAGNAYTRAELEEVVSWAEEQHLEVMPLVQTFGHVEFALKTQPWAHLREVPGSPQALCPSNSHSMDFIEDMIRQVMAVTPRVKYLHIGCDEVFQMGECAKCSLVPRDNLFLAHVARVASFVRREFPGVTPIIWDDMLRHVPASTIDEYKLGDLVEPMVWVYAEDVYRFVSSPVWDKYALVFPRVWAASAFKGAFGETMYVPNARRHLENNLRWLEVMTNESPRFKKGFAGIVLTGWQRYDHFAVLCELLPAAVPSLAVSLLATSHGFFNASMKAKLHEALSCPADSSQTTFLSLDSDPFMWNKLSRCFFPGSSFYKLLYRLHSTEREVNEYLKSVTRSKAWMTDYNVRRNYTSPLRVDELMQEQPHMQHSLATLARHARDALHGLFDSYTVAEWVEQRIYPDLKRLETFARDADTMKSVRYWAPRPLPPLQDLYKLGLLPQDSPPPPPAPVQTKR